MSDINPAAPQPFDTGAAARALYGDNPVEELPQLIDESEHPGNKLWAKDVDPGAAKQPPQQPPATPETPAPVEPQQPSEDFHVPEDLRTAFDSHTSELGIDGTSAEKLFTKMQPVIEAQQREAVEDQIDKWSDESHEHFGDGLNDALKYAGQALHAHEGGKELEAFLDKSGLSANKTVLLFLNSVAKRQRR